MKCAACPIASRCLGEDHFPFFCDWARGGDPVHLDHIRLRSALPYEPPPTKEPATPPGLLRKAANLAQAVVAHVRAGLPTVDAATAAARLATCRACDQLDGDSCRQCGCNMPVKVTWGEQACPLARWGPVG